MGMGSGVIFSETRVVPSVTVRYGAYAQNGASLSDVKHGHPGSGFNGFIVEEPLQVKRMVTLDN